MSQAVSAPGAPADPGDIPEARRRRGGVDVVGAVEPSPGCDRRRASSSSRSSSPCSPRSSRPTARDEKVGPPFEPPSSAHWLGLDDGGVDMVTPAHVRARASRSSSASRPPRVAMLIGGAVGILAGYFGGKTDIDAHADHRLLPRHPRRPAHDRDRRHLGPEPHEHHHHHRRHLLDGHGADHPRAGEEHPRAGVRAPGAGPRREQQQDHLPTRPPAGGAAPRRQHRPHGRDRHLRGDCARVPRAGRSEPHLLGTADRERVRLERDHGRCMVGDRPARHRRRGRHPRLHDARHVDRGRAQPAPARRPPLRAAVPPPPRPGEGRRREQRAGARGSRTSTSGSTCRTGRELHAVQGVGFDALERRALRPRRRVRVWQDDDDPGADGPPALERERRRPRLPRGQGHPRTRRGEREPPPLDATWRWSSRGR